MTYRLASQTSGFNGERRAPDSPIAPGNEPREDRMFTLKGKVSSLEISDGSANPLQAFQQRRYGSAVETPIADASSAVPSARRIAVQHFGCCIGDRVVVGTFPAVGFKNGDAVKAVVTNLDGEGVFAHAVMTAANGRLWLPYAVCRGTHASLIAMAKVAAPAALAAWMWALLLMLAWPPRSGVFGAASLAGLAIVLFGALVVFFVNRDSPEGQYANKILTMLGFKNPKMVDLAPFSERQQGSPHVYDLWAALAACGAVKRRKAA